MTASMRSTRRVDWLSAIVLVSAGLATAMQSLHGDVGVPQLSSNSGQVHLDDASAARVNVELYMEALCPYCAGFVREQLGDVMRELSDLVDLTLVPFGNAQVQKDGTIKCQHGEDECLGNKILSCAMEKHPKQDQWFLFAWCCEHSHATTSPMMDAAARCADKIGWGFSAIKECVEGPEGDELQRKAQEATAALDPPHKWVPWVIVNGIPIFDDTTNVKQYICAAYTGTKPEACFTPPVLSTPQTPILKSLREE